MLTVCSRCGDWTQVRYLEVGRTGFELVCYYCERTDDGKKTEEDEPEVLEKELSLKGNEG